MNISRADPKKTSRALRANNPGFTDPVLVCGVSDDRFAARAATEGLLAKLPNTKVQRWYVDTAKLGKVGHFGYFRSRMENAIWSGLRDWLNQQTNSEGHTT